MQRCFHFHNLAMPVCMPFDTSCLCKQRNVPVSGRNVANSTTPLKNRRPDIDSLCRYPRHPHTAPYSSFAMRDNLGDRCRLIAHTPCLCLTQQHYACPAERDLLCAGVPVASPDAFPPSCTHWISGLIQNQPKLHCSYPFMHQRTPYGTMQRQIQQPWN